MFCPKCGNPDQVADSYCRKCGEFLSDFSGPSFLLNKLLGGQAPETQVTVNLIVNAVTGLVSMLLLGFLNGYYDAAYAKTHVGPPSVIYLVYIFLGLVTAWQLFSFLIGLRLRSKFAGRKSPLEPAESTDHLDGRLPSALPEAGFESVTEDTTRMLDALPRKK